MPEYRAYLIGSDGHFYKSIALHAPDEPAAIAAARQLVDGDDVELWQRDRKIGKFEQKK
jgi:hypothetical protein